MAGGEDKPTGEGPQSIQLSSLGIQELHMLKQRISEEAAVLSNQLEALRMAVQRLRGCREAVQALSGESKGSEILMPLTSSVYIPAKLESVDTVLIDVGTGYHLQKSTADAIKYYDKRADTVSDKIGLVVKAVQEKQRLLEGVQFVMQQKLSMQQASAAPVGSP